MSRGLEVDDGRDEERRAATSGFDGTAVRSARVGDRPRDPRMRSATLPHRHFTLPRGPARETVWGGARSYRLRDTESHVLTAAGIFRVVFERDLEQTGYRGDPTRLAQDVRHLMRQGLLERYTVAADHRGRALAVLNLTRDGHALLERCRQVAEPDDRDRRQSVSSGWRKVSEVVHDASLFRVYQVEAARIEAGGGVIRRIVLGDDLKRQCYAAGTPQTGASPEARHAALWQAATELALPVVAGHVEFPDLRIEYDTAAGDRTRVDVELVTDAYRPGQIAAKQRAGFALYSAAGSVRHGIAALSGPAGLPPRAGASHDHSWSSLLSL